MWLLRRWYHVFKIQRCIKFLDKCIKECTEMFNYLIENEADDKDLWKAALELAEKKLIACNSKKSKFQEILVNLHAGMHYDHITYNWVPVK